MNFPVRKVYLDKREHPPEINTVRTREVWPHCFSCQAFLGEIAKANHVPPCPLKDSGQLHFSALYPVSVSGLIIEDQVSFINNKISSCEPRLSNPMPICIECRHPVKTLWREGAGDKAGGHGHNIRLTVCKNCGRFCDKYVEHDFVVLFIDLVLIKPQVFKNHLRYIQHCHDIIALCLKCSVSSLFCSLQQVYRHLLHNTLMKDDDEFAVSDFSSPSLM